MYNISVINPDGIAYEPITGPINITVQGDAASGEQDQLHEYYGDCRSYLSGQRKRNRYGAGVVRVFFSLRRKSI